MHGHRRVPQLFLLQARAVFSLALVHGFKVEVRFISGAFHARKGPQRLVASSLPPAAFFTCCYTRYTPIYNSPCGPLRPYG